MKNLLVIKKYRNKLNGLIRLSRKIYYSEKLENKKNYVNGLWDTVNDLIGKTKNIVQTYFMMMANNLPIQTIFQMHLINTSQI